MKAGSVESALHTLITRLTGHRNVGDTPGNRGQCVGLVEVYLDELCLPHVWGNAKDLLDNAPSDRFTVVRNGPKNYPAPGDIVVWGNTWGLEYGHTGIAVTAAVMHLVVFQQNDPDGSPPHLKNYTYDGVIGWLHPLVTL